MHRLLLPLTILAAVTLAACTNGGSSTANQGFSPAKPPVRTASYFIVTSDCGGASNLAQVESWGAATNGDALPFTRITGSNTNLGNPFLDYVDSHGITWVASTTGIVSTYPSTSSGNIAPYASISGGNTTFGEITGVTVDSSGNVYAADFSANAVDVFNAGSYSVGVNNNIAPSRRIVGGNTGLQYPEGIAVDSSGDIYVANSNAGRSVVEFSSGASGNASPVMTISGGNTTFNFLGGLALDSTGNLWVADQGAQAVDEFAPQSAGTHNVAPSKRLVGANTDFSNPVGVALDKQGYIYVADYAAAAVYVFGPAESGNVSPAQIVSGGNTDLCQPQGVTVH